MHKNILKDNILFLSILLVFSGVCLYGCKKEEKTVHFTNLTTLPRIVRVGDTSGSAIIKLYTNGNWKAALNDKAGWITLDERAGSEKENLGVNFKDNKGKLPRSTKLFITSDHKTDSVFIIQGGLISLNATVDTLRTYAKGGDLGIRLSSDRNVPDSLVRETVVYADGGGSKWISGFTFVGDSIKFNLSQSESSNPRSAVIYLSFKGPLKSIIADSIRVIQETVTGSARFKSFSFLKDTLSSGDITKNIYIQGVVISDKDNPNMARNPNLSKTKIDKSVNKKTVYIQSMNGQGGIKLVTNSVGDNNFKKNTVVKIWIKGLTLVKHTNPSYAVLKGVQLKNVIFSKQNPNPLVPKEVSIKDLTDDDLFTFVSLKDVEISIPDGSFRNVNEGYDSRADTYAMNIRGIDGDNMYMLFNYDIPYARTGKQVPQGSGSISGILVHENLPRYGGDIGTYQIRPTERSDISLSDPRFSKVLVKWTRFKTENETNPTASKNPLTPDIGSGTLTASQRNPSKSYSKDGGIYGEVGYNGLTTADDLLHNGAFAIWNWWGTGTGNYWLVKVSTLGITTPLTIAFNGDSKIGGPRNWALEWSSTGAAGSWEKVADFTFPDVVNWGNTLYTQLPGFKGYSFQLPIAASGLPTLYVRLVVTNKDVGTKTSSTGGTMNYKGRSLLGYLSLEYNK